MALSMQTRRLALGLARVTSCATVRPLSTTTGFKGQQQEQTKEQAYSNFRLVAAIGAGVAGLGLYSCYEKPRFARTKTDAHGFLEPKVSGSCVFVFAVSF